MVLGCNINESKLWARINIGASMGGLSVTAIATEGGVPHTGGLGPPYVAGPLALIGEDDAAFPKGNSLMSLLATGEEEGEGDEDIEDAGETVMAVGKESTGMCWPKAGVAVMWEEDAYAGRNKDDCSRSEASLAEASSGWSEVERGVSSILGDRLGSIAKVVPKVASWSDCHWYRVVL